MERDINKDYFQKRIEELLKEGKTYEEAVFEASDEINEIIKNSKEEQESVSNPPVEEAEEDLEIPVV